MYSVEQIYHTTFWFMLTQIWSIALYPNTHSWFEIAALPLLGIGTLIGFLRARAGKMQEYAVRR